MFYFHGWLLFFKVDMQALGQQVTDKKQQEDYERKRELAFGMNITFTFN